MWVSSPPPPFWFVQNFKYEVIWTISFIWVIWLLRKKNNLLQCYTIFFSTHHSWLTNVSMVLHLSICRQELIKQHMPPRNLWSSPQSCIISYSASTRYGHHSFSINATKLGTICHIELLLIQKVFLKSFGNTEVGNCSQDGRKEK